MSTQSFISEKEKNEFMETFCEQMIAQESDRGCALVAVSILDNDLEKILRRIFSSEKKTIKNSVKSLFLVMGPPSSFWAKVQLTNSLHLLSEETYKDLETIREIRNKFAHISEPIDFDDKEIVKLLNKLNTEQGGVYAKPTNSSEDKKTKLKREAEILEKGFVRLTKTKFVVAVACLHVEFLKLLITHKLLHKS